MIIANKTRVQFKGIECVRTFDYYATKSGAVKCRVTYTPTRKELRHLRGHATVQLLNLALLASVSDAMLFLGVQLDDAPAAELFAALAGSNLPADRDATCIADYLNA